jgi:hypothetical protein
MGWYALEDIYRETDRVNADRAAKDVGAITTETLREALRKRGAYAGEFDAIKHPTRGTVQMYAIRRDGLHVVIELTSDTGGHTGDVKDVLVSAPVFVSLDGVTWHHASTKVGATRSCGCSVKVRGLVGVLPATNGRELVGKILEAFTGPLAIGRAVEARYQVNPNLARVVDMAEERPDAWAHLVGKGTKFNKFSETVVK